MAHIIQSQNDESLRTPPSSSTPLASGERKRKRTNESTTSDDSIPKRAKRPGPLEAQPTLKEILESPTKASIREAPRSPDADLPLSPRSPQGSEVRSSYQPRRSKTRAQSDRDIVQFPEQQDDITGEDPEPPTELHIDKSTSVEVGQLQDIDFTRRQGSTESSVGHWVLKGNWPKEHFIEEHAMNTPLGKKRSSSTLKDQSQSDITDISGKEKEYQSPQFEILLATAGIYIEEDLNVPPSQSCKDLCSRLFRGELMPSYSLQGSQFTCRMGHCFHEITCTRPRSMVSHALASWAYITWRQNSVFKMHGIHKRNHELGKMQKNARNM